MNEFCKYKTNAGLLGKFHKKSGKNEGLSVERRTFDGVSSISLKNKVFDGWQSLNFLVLLSHMRELGCKSQ